MAATENKFNQFTVFELAASASTYDFTGLANHPVYCKETKMWGLVKPTEDGVIWTPGVADIAFDTGTNVLTSTLLDGTTKTINFPEERFLSGGSYNDETHILTLTLNDTSTITIDISKLMNVYTVADTSTVDMTMTDGEITASVKVSANNGNSIEVKSDGLYAAASKIIVISE